MPNRESVNTLPFQLGIAKEKWFIYVRNIRCNSDFCLQNTQNRSNVADQRVIIQVNNGVLYEVLLQRNESYVITLVRIHASSFFPSWIAKNQHSARRHLNRKYTLFT